MSSARLLVVILECRNLQEYKYTVCIYTYSRGAYQCGVLSFLSLVLGVRGVMNIYKAYHSD